MNYDAVTKSPRVFYGDSWGSYYIDFINFDQAGVSCSMNEARTTEWKKIDASLREDMAWKSLCYIRHRWNKDKRPVLIPSRTTEAENVFCELLLACPDVDILSHYPSRVDKKYDAYVFVMRGK